MNFTIQDIIGLANALSPFVVPSVEAITGALTGSGAMTADEIDTDLTNLIVEALDAKTIADRAAAGLDPQ
jgi:hypothetical protein